MLPKNFKLEACGVLKCAHVGIAPYTHDLIRSVCLIDCISATDLESLHRTFLVFHNLAFVFFFEFQQ